MRLVDVVWYDSSAIRAYDIGSFPNADVNVNLVLFRIEGHRRNEPWFDMFKGSGYSFFEVSHHIQLRRKVFFRKYVCHEYWSSLLQMKTIWFQFGFIGSVVIVGKICGPL